MSFVLFLVGLMLSSMVISAVVYGAMDRRRRY